MVSEVILVKLIKFKNQLRLTSGAHLERCLRIKIGSCQSVIDELKRASIQNLSLVYACNVQTHYNSGETATVELATNLRIQFDGTLFGRLENQASLSFDHKIVILNNLFRPNHVQGESLKVQAMNMSQFEYKVMAGLAIAKFYVQQIPQMTNRCYCKGYYYIANCR